MNAAKHTPPDYALFANETPCNEALPHQGDIPAVRLGRAVRVRPQDLARFIESNVCGSGGMQPYGNAN